MLILLFWSPSASALWSANVRSLARSMDLLTAARFEAIGIAAVTNALIAVWDAKYTYMFWRPVTAIRAADTDGNSKTEPDPAWTPFIVADSSVLARQSPRGPDSGRVGVARDSLGPADHVRTGDIACRYGGDEFCLILPDTSAQQLVKRADELRRAISQLTIQCHGIPRSGVTTSIGAAVFPDHGLNLCPSGITYASNPSR